MQKETKKKKADYDRLSERIQVLLKPNEFKNVERLRRDSLYSTNAAYVRALLIEKSKDKRQVEMF